MSDRVTRCPRCGEAPQTVARVGEPATSGFGLVAEPKIVERGTCPKGHQWFASDEPQAGDVAIHRKSGMSVCSFGLVPYDGARPLDWKTGTITDAETFADRWTKETGGRVRTFDVFAVQRARIRVRINDEHT